MSFVRKQQWVRLALVAMIAWPVAHHALVRVLDVSPWKGFGWAMYSVPPQRVYADLLDATGQPLRWGSLSTEQRRAVVTAFAEFSRWRTEFGAWIRPDDLARELLRHIAAPEGIRIRVRTEELDRTSAMIGPVGEPDEYFYSESDFGGR